MAFRAATGAGISDNVERQLRAQARRQALAASATAYESAFETAARRIGGAASLGAVHEHHQVIDAFDDSSFHRIFASGFSTQIERLQRRGVYDKMAQPDFVALNDISPRPWNTSGDWQQRKEGLYRTRVLSRSSSPSKCATGDESGNQFDAALAELDRLDRKSAQGNALEGNRTVSEDSRTSSEDEAATGNGSALTQSPSVPRRRRGSLEHIKGSAKSMKAKGSAKASAAKLAVKEAVKRKVEAGFGGPGHSFRFVVRPHSKFQARWDIAVMVGLLYTAFFTPYQIGYLSEGPDGWTIYNVETWWVIFALDRLVDVLFISDIVVNFRSGWVDTISERVVFDPNIAAASYVKGWFCIDVMASIPYDIITPLFVDRVSNAARLPKILRLFRLFKIVRILKMSRIIKRYEEGGNMTVQYATLSMVKLMVFILMLTHWTACLWMISSNLIRQTDEETFEVLYDHNETSVTGMSWEQYNGWYSSEHRNDGTPVGQLSKADHASTDTPGRSMAFWSIDPLVKYNAAVYWAYNTISSVGMGDIVASSTVERVIASLTTLVGTGVLGYIVGALYSAVQGRGMTANKFEETVDNFNEYGNKKNRDLGKDYMVSIRKFFYYWRKEKRGARIGGYDFMRSYHIRPAFSDNLLRQVRMDRHASTMEQLPILEGADEETLLTFDVLGTKSIRVHPEEVIFLQGTRPVHNDHVYLLLSGSITVEVRWKDNVCLWETQHAPCLLGEGAAVFHPQWYTRPYTVRAKNFCELRIIERSALRRFMRNAQGRGLPYSKRIRSFAVLNLWKKLRSLVMIPGFTTEMKKMGWGTKYERRMSLLGTVHVDDATATTDKNFSARPVYDSHKRTSFLKERIAQLPMELEWRASVIKDIMRHFPDKKQPGAEPVQAASAEDVLLEKLKAQQQTIDALTATVATNGEALAQVATVLEQAFKARKPAQRQRISTTVGADSDSLA